MNEKGLDILSLRNENQNDQIKLVYVGSGYAELVDVKGKKWRFVFGTDEWINEDVDDPNLEAPLGEVAVPFGRSDFKNKEEAFLYLKVLGLKSEVEKCIALSQDTELLDVYKKIKQLLEQAEQENDEAMKKELIQKAFTFYESEA